ncbi:MAG: 50S ribosomal protein L9, partial [Actinobacteria bacterium]|nr:50S ribosomal protein L9 [Actinomycetota bacterium]
SEMMRRARVEREQRAKDAAAARVAVLASEPVFISANAGPGGRLFGSVTASDIARGIAEQLEENIDRHDVRLDEPIRSLGSHQIEVKLHEEVNALVTVEVIPVEDE